MDIFYIKDLRNYIVGYLDLEDALNTCKINKDFYKSCLDYSFWRKFYEDNGITLPENLYYSLKEWVSDFKSKILARETSNLLVSYCKEGVEIYFLLSEIQDIDLLDTSENMKNFILPYYNQSGNKYTNMSFTFSRFIDFYLPQNFYMTIRFSNDEKSMFIIEISDVEIGDEGDYFIGDVIENIQIMEEEVFIVLYNMIINEKELKISNI